MRFVRAWKKRNELGFLKTARHERVSVHPASVDDLSEIWSYIARDNFEAADRVEEAVYSACAFLADSPVQGVFAKI